MLVVREAQPEPPSSTMRKKVSPSLQAEEAHPYIASLIALIMIALCLIASHWQYQRGVDRHARNTLIAAHVALAPTTLAVATSDLAAAEWRSIRIDGSFDQSKEILLRNRYSQGKYGFDLLTLFHESSGKTLWVDRGWIAAGASASTPPPIVKISKEKVSIVGRVRLDKSLPQGSFFALSAGTNSQLIPQWNAQSKAKIKSERFYLDLLSSSDPAINPAAPVELPELTDGPHMAYALQWIFFAGLVGYGRILLRRPR